RTAKDAALCSPKEKIPSGRSGWEENYGRKMAQATALFRLHPKRPRSAKAPPINQKVAGSGACAATSKVAPLAKISVAKKAPAEFFVKLDMERFWPVSAPPKLTSKTSGPGYGLLPPLSQTSQLTPYMKVP